MKILNYRILLRKESEGGYTVIVPSLPGCVTYGENIEHAIEMARQAIEAVPDEPESSRRGSTDGSEANCRDGVVVDYI